MVKMLVLMLVCLGTLGSALAIKLDGNGYVEILVVINPRVPENQEIIAQTKEMITRGSEYLFEALDHKLYYKEVKILVPPTWTAGQYERARTESYSKGKIIIDKAHSVFGDEPYTEQRSGCGKPASYIHFTPNFLLNQDLIKVYGPKGRVFVHEWAHLRWGVFDEYDKKQPFYMSGGQFLPTSCTDKISGKWLEVINQRAQPCNINGNVLSSSCEFYPDAAQNTNASIMYMPSLSSITAFCHENNHNFDAPNQQNRKCKKSTRAVIFGDSVDKDALKHLDPLQSRPSAPTFTVLKRGDRVICLVLDVSGSMAGTKILIQQQAAAVLINQLLRDGEFVGLVSFSDYGNILSPLTLIDGQTARDSLIQKLPITASGGTFICLGLRKGLEVLRSDDNDTTGDEIIFLTDGIASDTVQSCLKDAVNSRAIIHTIGFGDSVDDSLKTMANQTDGSYFAVQNYTLSNQLVDAFSSITMFDGNPLTQPVQLESTGNIIADWFNGTVTIDRSVGNQTTFMITYEQRPPSVSVQSPSGLVYDKRNTSDIANTITLIIPGTAEPGDWKYSFYSTGNPQAISIIVLSQAAHEGVYPVTVTARMEQQTSDGKTPLIVMAEVSQNYNPVLGADVWAELAGHTGQTTNLQLLDNGAGADAQKDDGVYSRYFSKVKMGKYSLKVKVEKQQTGAGFAPHTHSSVLYVPGYIVDDQVELNPPKPPVNVQPVDVGHFTRLVTGESFEVPQDISVNFPPSQITDLSAELQEDVVLLNWTAPGGDLDQGAAAAYEIRWSKDLKTLQTNFGSANLMNTSTLPPSVYGSAEHYTFQPGITLHNGTTLFFAIQSKDQVNEKSEVSNIARVTKYIPTRGPSPISNPGLNLPAIIISVCGVTILSCVIAVVITWVVKRKRY